MSSFAWFFVSWFLVLGIPLLALGLTLALGLALLAWLSLPPRVPGI